MKTRTAAKAIVDYYEEATSLLDAQYQENCQSYRNYLKVSQGLLGRIEMALGVIEAPKNPGLPIKSLPELADIVPQLVEDDDSYMKVERGMRLLYAEPKVLHVNANQPYSVAVQESVILCCDGSFISSRIEYEGARPAHAHVEAYENLRELIRSNNFGPQAQKEILHNFLLHSKGRGFELERMHLGAVTQ